jgi:hypothetical protein
MGHFHGYVSHNQRVTRIKTCCTSGLDSELSPVLSLSMRKVRDLERNIVCGLHDLQVVVL